MSINNSILKLLNMEDHNLIFDENFCEERNIKNKKYIKKFNKIMKILTKKTDFKNFLAIFSFH